MAYTSEIEKLERRWLENPKGRNFAPLADAYRKAGELDRAIDLCKSGLERHPDYVSAHIVYGRCLTDLKRDDEAAEAFRKVLGLDPENIIGLKILGEIAERNNRFDEAVEWLGRLLNADPMNGDAAEHLARAKSKAATAKPTQPVASSLAEAPTAAMGQPDFVVEPTSTPAPKRPSGAAPSPDIETFDGSIAFNASAHAAAKADGLEVQEDVELSSQQVERVEIEGLARTQYEGSGMFKLDTPPPPEAAAPPPSSELDESLPPVDLPLIMPEDLPRTSTAARQPAPRPPAPRASVPAAVALSDDDGAADTATLSKAEPVLTETMAELYLKQGHEHEALRVYQALLAQRPGDAKLKRRVEHLSGGGRRKSGVSAQAFLKSILSGRGAPAAAPASAPATTLDAAFDAAAGGDEGGPPGQPTHPADDHISLDSVFGEDSTRRPRGGPAAAAPSDAAESGEGGAGGGFSFDQFFGAAQGSAPASPDAGAGAQPGARTPGRSSGRTQRPAENEGELDQFQQWLKKLKS